MVKKKNLKLQVQSIDAKVEAETETGDLFLLLPGNGDWRSLLPPDFRQQMVKKIMEFLERHGPFSGPEGLLEIKEKAGEFEEKSYTAATSQSDYLKKISLKMLAQSPMENVVQPTRGNSTQNHANSGMPSNQQNVHVLQHSRVSAPQSLQHTGGSQQHADTLQRDMQQRLQPSSSLLQRQLFQPLQYLDGPSTSLDSTAQTGSVHPGDWQEEAYQKIRYMKEMYFADLNELYQILASGRDLHFNPQQPKNEYDQQLKKFKVILETMLQFLRLNKNDIQMAQRDKIAHWEKEIVKLMYVISPRLHAMRQNQQSQSQTSQMQQHESQLSSQMQ